MLTAAHTVGRQIWRRLSPASSSASTRSFRGTTSDGGWKNETPAGSSTEVFVYNPEFDINWPNPQLGVLSSKDKNFALPGDIGAVPDGSLDSITVQLPVSRLPDIITAPTAKESQVHALYNANDYIRYTQGSHVDVFSEPELIKTFPELPSSCSMDMQVHSAPTLLRKELGPMFPNKDLNSGPVSVITISFSTDNDMSKWSPEVEEERDKLTHDSVVTCKEICGRLKEEGYWADFIDPSSGTPHYSSHTNHTLFETDERYRMLGFTVEDLGCCKVISHGKFGRNVFVATIITNASMGSDVLDNITMDLNC